MVYEQKHYPITILWLYEDGTDGKNTNDKCTYAMHKQWIH